MKATFAMGCFWGPEEYFSKLKGVRSTKVGYSGGPKKNPTYEDLGNHTESIEIIFDSDKITYKELLKHFWEQHDPTANNITQYKSIIFFHNKTQQKLAEKSKEEFQKKTNKEILTEIRPASVFYDAEEYHQKFLEKRKKTFLGRLLHTILQ